MDQQQTKDGKPLGPIQFKEIIKQLWFISKNIHTSYTDLLDITPVEKLELLNLIKEDIENENKRNAEFISNMKKKKK